MKTLKRNKRTFYYATYIGKTEILDANGNHTFEYKNSYSEWKPFSAHISPAKGESSAELFGNDISYDKTIVTDDLDCEIDENTILCIDILPNFPPEPPTPEPPTPEEPTTEEPDDDEVTPTDQESDTNVTPTDVTEDEPVVVPLVYDYIVTKKAKSINFVQYAVSKVNVNA